MKLYNFTIGRTPLLATAIHDGHDLRKDVERLCALDGASRLREEDPFTGQWTAVTDNSIIVRTSRFEMDLNRPRERAVYIKPKDAWGLKVWKKDPSREMIDESLAQYDAFYDDVFELLTSMRSQFGKFVVFDLHSYNHRREGADAEPENPEENPEVNIGTGTMLDRSRWAPIIDRFINDLSHFDLLGRHLDVRENVKFYGGNFPRWIHKHFSGSACALSIEFKKFFMDEWSGRPDKKQLQAITDALRYTVPGVLEELKKL